MAGPAVRVLIIGIGGDGGGGNEIDVAEKLASLADTATKKSTKIDPEPEKNTPPDPSDVTLPVPTRGGAPVITSTLSSVAAFALCIPKVSTAAIINRLNISNIP